MVTMSAVLQVYWWEFTKTLTTFGCLWIIPLPHKAALVSAIIMSNLLSPIVPLIGHLEECLLLQSAAVELHFTEKSQVFSKFLRNPWQASENVMPDCYAMAEILSEQPVEVRILLTRLRWCNRVFCRILTHRCFWCHDSCCVEKIQWCFTSRRMPKSQPFHLFLTMVALPTSLKIHTALTTYALCNTSVLSSLLTLVAAESTMCIIKKCTTLPFPMSGVVWHTCMPTYSTHHSRKFPANMAAWCSILVASTFFWASAVFLRGAGFMAGSISSPAGERMHTVYIGAFYSPPLCQVSLQYCSVFLSLLPTYRSISVPIQLTS